MKLSQWHDISIDPAHVGVYKIKVGRQIKYSFWNGRKFIGAWASISLAYLFIRPKSWMYDYKSRLVGAAYAASAWRGIVK